MDLCCGARHGDEEQGARNHRGRGGDQLHEAHGAAVDDGPEAAAHQLGQGVPDRRAIHHPRLQADVQPETGRHQENSLLQRNQRLHLCRHFAHCHPGTNSFHMHCSIIIHFKLQNLITYTGWSPVCTKILIFI